MLWEWGVQAVKKIKGSWNGIMTILYYIILTDLIVDIYIYIHIYVYVAKWIENSVFWSWLRHQDFLPNKLSPICRPLHDVSSPRWKIFQPKNLLAVLHATMDHVGMFGHNALITGIFSTSRIVASECGSGPGVWSWRYLKIWLKKIMLNQRITCLVVGFNIFLRNRPMVFYSNSHVVAQKFKPKPINQAIFHRKKSSSKRSNWRVVRDSVHVPAGFGRHQEKKTYTLWQFHIAMENHHSNHS